MKQLLFIFVVLISTSSLALSQGGNIALYSDPFWIDCTISDSQTGPIYVFVVHTNTSAASASAFSVPIPACAVGVTWLSDIKEFPVTIGFSPTDIVVAYGRCLVSPILLMTILYWGQGLSEPCCVMTVGGSSKDCPSSPCMIDCDDNLLPASGNSAIINADHTCTCDMVPTEDSTWGKVKSLYYVE